MRSSRGVFPSASALALALALAMPIACVVGCTNLRTGSAGAAVDAGSAGDAGATVVTGNAVVANEPLTLTQVPDVPLADYRSVFAASPNRVYVVGGETILEWDGSVWQRTDVGGVSLTGVWGNDRYALAVGTFTGTDRGVAMIRSPSQWVQFATVDHGLRAVWGSGSKTTDRVYVVGNDGATYFGPQDTPMAQGVQESAPPDVPASMTSTLFFPVLGAVWGNSADHVAVAGPAATLYAYHDGAWHGEHQSVDLTRSFSAVWGPPGSDFDLVVGGNYYSLWTFHGGQKDPQTGELATMSMLNEERDDIQRGSQFVYGVWGDSTDHFLAVGSTGRVMLFDHGPHVHVFSTPAGARDLHGISGTSWNDLWIVGDQGVLLHGSLTTP